MHEGMMAYFYYMHIGTRQELVRKTEATLYVLEIKGLK